MPFLVNFEFKKVHPLDSFELVFDQHFLYQFLALVRNRINFFRNSKFSIFYNVDQLTNWAWLKGAEAEEHFEQNNS